MLSAGMLPALANARTRDVTNNLEAREGAIPSLFWDKSLTR